MDSKDPIYEAARVIFDVRSSYPYTMLVGRLWLVRVGKASCIVGPCSLDDMISLLKSWGHSGDNRDGSFGYQPANI